MAVLFMDSLKEIHWGAPKILHFIRGKLPCLSEYPSNGYQISWPVPAPVFPNALEMNLDYLEQNHIDLVVTNYSEYVSDQLIGNWHCF